MIKFRNCSYLKSLRRHSEGKNSVITIASGFSFMLENNFPDSVQELAVKIKRHLLKKICFKAWSFYKPENLICYEFTKQHCCKLQAVYSPITVKKFVTMYSGFDPCNKGSFTNYVYKFLAFLTTYPPSFTLSTLWNLTFFDYLPTSLCKRSLWMTPIGRVSWIDPWVSRIEWCEGHWCGLTYMAVRLSNISSKTA